MTGKPLAEDSKIEFRFFNRDTVKPAVEEINEVSELIIQVREIRVGKSIEFLQFDVRKKPTKILEKPEAMEGSALAKAEKLGIPDAMAEELWFRYGNEDLLAALNKLAQRLSQIASPVRSKVAYLKAVLANKGMEEETALIESAQEKKVQEAPKENPAEAMQKLMQEAEQNRVAKVRSEIQALNPEARDELLLEFKAFAVSANKLPAIVKKIEKGEWQSGLVLGELMRFYWKKTRNLAWTDLG